MIDSHPIGGSTDAGNKQRESFLHQLVEALSKDDRFPAAWLTGSFARGEQDALSDIDITLAVAEAHREILCARPWQVSPQTTPERYELFGSFGQPAILHENNRNAPEGGTFTFVAYARSAIMVDWILRPVGAAQRPPESLLLWDRVGIPLQPPSEPDSRQQRLAEASEIIAFFWMMTAVTIKYIYRGDLVFVNTWLEELTKLILDVERRVKGQGWKYKRSSQAVLTVTPEEQIIAIRRLCEQMEKLMPAAAQLGAYVAGSPMSAVEILIQMVEEKHGQ